MPFLKSGPENARCAPFLQGLVLLLRHGCVEICSSHQLRFYCWCNCWVTNHLQEYVSTGDNALAALAWKFLRYSELKKRSLQQ